MPPVADRVAGAVVVAAVTPVDVLIVANADGMVCVDGSHSRGICATDEVAVVAPAVMLEELMEVSSLFTSCPAALTAVLARLVKSELRTELRMPAMSFAAAICFGVASTPEFNAKPVTAEGVVTTGCEPSPQMPPFSSVTGVPPLVHV